jgi:hypothetical protein
MFPPLLLGVYCYSLRDPGGLDLAWVAHPPLTFYSLGRSPVFQDPGIFPILHHYYSLNTLSNLYILSLE